MPRFGPSLRSGALRSVPPSKARLLSVDRFSVDEGGSVTFSIRTSRPKFADGTVIYWTTDGNVNGNDFTDSQIRGTATVLNGTAEITRTLAEDVGVEFNERFRLIIRESGYWGPILRTTPWINVIDGSTAYTFTINSSATTANEGAAVTFTVSSPDAPDGYLVYWTLNTNMSNGNFAGSLVQGSAEILNGQAVFSITTSYDVSEIPNKTYQVQLRKGSIGGSIVALSPTVSVQESPPWLLLTNPSGGQTYYWRGVTAAIQMNTAGDWTASVLETTTVRVKCWGAAGGGQGGTGGFAQGQITMTAGQTYKVRVGGGGKTASSGGGYAGGFGGGGLCGKSNNSGEDWKTGSGGGLTGLFINSVSQANSRIVAGGGAGGRNGGGGGGSSGQNGANTGNGRGGGGGTQSAGGVRGINSVSSYNVGSTNGSALTGGQGASGTSQNFSGGGGGGGYWGGGGGSGNNYVGGSGGGGSGYLSGTSIVFADRVNQVGSQGYNTTRNAPYNTDVDYTNNAGRSTSYSIGVAQPNGLAVFRPIL